MGESMSNKYGKNLLDSLKESAIDAVKTSPKRVVQKCQKRLVTWFKIKSRRELEKLLQRVQKRLEVN